MAWLLSCALKAALLLAASGLGALLLRRGTAAARHQIWTLGVLGALLLPLLCWVMPSLAVPSESLAIVSAGSLEAVFVTAGPAAEAAPTWPMWLAIAWALGTLVVVLRLVLSQLAARRLLRTADARVPASWSSALRGLGNVELLRSEHVGSPMTIGVLRPRVILPVAADAWSGERLRAVLVHELGHVRRRDTAIQLAAQLACALYWWNPLAWLAAARLRIEREHACDDLVLDAGILPSSYAADLLDVARSISVDAHAGACMVDRSWTETRLRRILDATAPRRPLRARFRLAACGLALAGVVTLACTSSKPVLAPAPEVAPAPAPLGMLSVGAPVVHHPEMFRAAPDLAPVAAEVKRRISALEECYERRLAAQPALSGTVEIHWTILATGEVPESCVTTDTVGDREITECVNKLVKERFPAPAGGAVAVSLPFVFTSR